MSRWLNIGRLYIGGGRIPSHHHFAMDGEPWTCAWTPSQSRPVLWQIVRAETWKATKPLIWILWLYPNDGSAIYIEFGRLSKQDA